MNIWQKKQSGQIEDRTVNIEKYLDMAITDGLASPRESALANNFASGLEVLKLAGYQTEVLGRAKKLIEIPEDSLFIPDYPAAIAKERENLKDDPGIETKIAVFKIAYVLKEFETGKPKRDDMKT